MLFTLPSKIFFLAALMVFISVFLPLPAAAATLPSGFTETSVSGFSSPTSVSLHPDGRIFVTQQGGDLRIVKNGVLLATPFVIVSTTASGERGLLSVAFDPNYTVNHYVYVYYTALTPAIHNRISRFTADPNNEDVALEGSEFFVMDLDNLSGATNHNGGPIHFGPDGKLYVGVGENATSSNAQSLSNRLGKMLRINSDGTIPGDNPSTFPNISGSTTGLNQAIWAVGMRNPYTFSFQPGTGRMFINDVGNVTWEEIDNGVAGLNYGWPTCEGIYLNSTSTPCNTPGLTDSIYTYSSATASECAITGGDFYNPTTATFPVQYQGKYFFSDYCGGWIKYIDPASPPGVGAATTFATGISSPIDIDVAADGSLYYLARGAGSVFRIQYTAGSSPTPTNTPTNTPTATPTQTQTPFPELDLTVGQADSPDPVGVGQPLTYTLTVTNSPAALGGFACPNVRFIYPTGVQFNFNSTSGTNGFSGTADVNGITYTGGCLSSSGGTTATATLTLVITPLSTGTLTSLGASVVVDPENNIPENDENNNTATTVQTTVTTVVPAISGTITYGNAIGAPTPRFVSNVLLSGAGSIPVSASSSFPNGTYLLSGFGSGAYTVTPSKTGGINGSITSFDAAKIAQHAAGVSILTGNQLVVADVSGNGTISSFDAGQIARYAAGLSGFGSTANWIFTPANRNYASVSSNVTGEDFIALLMGEVSGNWTNTGARPVNGK